MRTAVVTIVTVFALLLTATPAGAVTGGFGVGEALRVGTILLGPSVTVKKHRPSTCDARDLQARRTAKTKFGQVTKQMAPVACEQPPRSELISPQDLRHAVTAALSVLG
jgi:hypothetical protein